MGATSSANNSGSQPDANARVFRLDDRDDVEDRGKPSILLDEEPVIAVREPHAAAHLALQHDQLLSERRVLGFKPALRLEWRDQDIQAEIQQRDYCALTLGDSVS